MRNRMGKYGGEHGNIEGKVRTMLYRHDTLFNMSIGSIF